MLDTKTFRAALSSFATGVTVVTTQDKAGQAVGMTASSFNSLSLNPPLILWSVTKTTGSAQAFVECAHFCINVLGADQAALSDHFARSGTDKFTTVPTENGLGNCQKINGAAAHFECRMWAIYEGGDHWIVVGQVERFTTTNRDGLVFARGRYALARPLSSKS